jgi:hypothetical protein
MPRRLADAFQLLPHKMSINSSGEALWCHRRGADNLQHSLHLRCRDITFLVKSDCFGSSEASVIEAQLLRRGGLDCQPVRDRSTGP